MKSAFGALFLLLLISSSIALVYFVVYQPLAPASSTYVPPTKVCSLKPYGSCAVTPDCNGYFSTLQSSACPNGLVGGCDGNMSNQVRCK